MDQIVIRYECDETLRVRPNFGGHIGNCKNCRPPIEFPAAAVIANFLGREVSLGEHSTQKNDAATSAAEKQTPARSNPSSSASGLWQPGTVD